MRISKWILTRLHRHHASKYKNVLWSLESLATVLSMGRFGIIPKLELSLSLEFIKVKLKYGFQNGPMNWFYETSVCASYLTALIFLTLESIDIQNKVNKMCVRLLLVSTLYWNLPLTSKTFKTSNEKYFINNLQLYSFCATLPWNILTRNRSNLILSKLSHWPTFWRIHQQAESVKHKGRISSFHLGTNNGTMHCVHKKAQSQHFLLTAPRN